MTVRRRTQVGIVGAGPAGLLLSQLLARRGISSVVVEARSRSYVESRVRAGVLEAGTVRILTDAGVGERLRKQGVVHRGIELRFEGESHRIDFEQLVPGRAITVYGQREVVKDLVAARMATLGAAAASSRNADGEYAQALCFDAGDVELHALASERPELTFQQAGHTHHIECDWIAGCDGFHGVSRSCIPADKIAVYERTYPFAWLGVLAAVAPSSQELIYARHERGFALHSMRGPNLSRFYLQVEPNEALDGWSDERIWSELKRRLETVPGFALAAGPIVEKSITPMRSFAVEPMRYQRLFLAGDAAHIVPATGAKGLNLAVADVARLSEALGQWYEGGADASRGLDRYSSDCLRRVWRVQDFSWWMTRLLHNFAADDAYERKLGVAQLRYLVQSRAAATTLAENYVGLPDC